MSWVAVEKDGCELICEYKPERINGTEWSDYGEIKNQNGEVYACYGDVKFDLPKGSIKKLIGRDLTWEDDCVELK